jgi:hypothetical protein
MGSDIQRGTIASWYREIAASASEDGTAYAGFCMMGTEDDRMSSASLTVRCEPTDATAANLVADALVEALSIDPAQEVHRVESNCGPVVVVFSGVRVAPPEEMMVAEDGDMADPVPPLVFARVDAYCPLPRVSRLLVFDLSTPSLAELPWYIAKLSEVVDTVEIVADQPSSYSSGSDSDSLSHARRDDAHPSTLSVRDVFG